VCRPHAILHDRGVPPQEGVPVFVTGGDMGSRIGLKITWYLGALKKLLILCFLKTSFVEGVLYRTRQYK
jgi:hypothetical protein